MTTWEVGQTATVTIGTPDGGLDTTLALTVTSPKTGTVTHPTASPNAGHTEWTLLLEITEPGDWAIVALAEGTGAGEASYTLTASPQPPPSTGLYANTGDYAAYTGQTPRPGLAQLLRRCSWDVRRRTMCAVYTAVDGLPTDATLLQALKDATSEQASYCIDTGRAKGVVGPTSQFTIGKLSVGRGAAASGGTTAAGPDFSPHADMILRDAGLVGAGPRS